MKVLDDMTEVPSRVWYYLLDWNDIDKHAYLYHKYGKNRLGSLTKTEFWEFFKYASESDLRKQ